MSGTTTLLAMACVLIVAATQAQAVYVGSPVEGRMKRQAQQGPPPMWKELMDCCRIPMIVKQEARRSCMPAGATAPVAGTPKNCGNHSCIIECAYKAQGLLNSASTAVDLTKLTASIKDLANANPPWASILNAALATCTASGLPAATATNTCKSGSAEVTACINNELFMKCPAGVKNTSARCADILANAGKYLRSG